MKSFEVQIKYAPTGFEAELKNLINDLVEYLYEDEERHFEEYDYKPTDHIFLKIKRLKELSQYL
jgi:hypothetical protein